MIRLTGGVAPPDDGEGLAPIPLPAEEPVAQLVVDGLFAEALGCKPRGDFRFGFGGGEVVEKVRVHGDAVVQKADGIFPSRGLHDDAHWQVKLLGELQVTRVVAWHRHDCPRAVAREHVVGNPDGDALAVDRVAGMRAGEDAGLLLRQLGAFEVGLLGDFSLVGFNRSALLRRGQVLHQLVLR